MDISYMALLAIKLSILTFYLGVLIYSLPIPIRSIKKWGPELIWDSMLALLIVLLYSVLYEASFRLASLLGGSKALFINWYGNSVATALSIKVITSILQSFPSSLVFSNVISALVIPFDRIATLTIIFLTTLGGIGELVFVYGIPLMVIGVVLFSLPFKIARSAGAWLISFILVFTIGLQLLPVFILNIASYPNIDVENQDYKLVAIRVVSNLEHPASNGILILKRPDSSIVASYVISSDGYAKSKYANHIFIAVPSNTLYPYLEYSGVLLPLYPNPINIGDYKGGDTITLKSPHTIIFKNPLILVYTTSSTYNILESGDSYNIVVWLNAGDYIEARVPGSCINNVNSNSSIKSYEWEWRGVKGSAYRIEASQPSHYAMNITVSSCTPVSLHYGDTIDYIDTVIGSLSFFDINILKAFILYYLTIPAIYVFILFLITSGIASLLGGKGRIPIKVA
ncbi:MAG: hypothetical protein QXO93_02120 [Acidilobaceae archaeon]